VSGQLPIDYFLVGLKTVLYTCAAAALEPIWRVQSSILRHISWNLNRTEPHRDATRDGDLKRRYLQRRYLQRRSADPKDALRIPNTCARVGTVDYLIMHKLGRSPTQFVHGVGT
jgi:hypothetical protein